MTPILNNCPICGAGLIGDGYLENWSIAEANYHCPTEHYRYSYKDGVEIEFIGNKKFTSRNFFYYTQLKIAKSLWKKIEVRE